MSDIALVLKDEYMDINVLEGDLQADDGLETAVLISLYTDGRADVDELLETETDRKGYWGDMIPDIDGDKMGSKLWLLSREKRTQEVLDKFQTYARNSLLWLVEDGVAETINVSTSFDGDSGVKLAIEITKPNDLGNSSFVLVWDGQELKRG